MILARPRPVPVPDLTGKLLAQARSEAVVPGSTEPLFASINFQGPENGVVATQHPLPGTPVIPGSSRLFLTMAAPKRTPLQVIWGQLAPAAPKTVVPKLQGTRDDASRDLEIAHLKAAFTGDAGGNVVQQYPQYGTEVPKWSVVTVTLAIPEVIVPSLDRLTLEQASERLQENSLQLGRIEGENIQASTVTSQYPPAGAQAPPGTQVAVAFTVSKPPSSLVYVPNLGKKSLSDAEAALMKVGLRTGEVKGPAKLGLVSDQRPSAGTAVPADTAVDFTLSLRTVIVPDVTDETESVAVISLKNFGLIPRVSRSKNLDDNAQLVVVKQDPPAGSTVAVESQVTVTLGNQAPLPQPNLFRRAETALSMMPGWVWLALGLPLGAIGVGVFKAITNTPPVGHCTLKPEIATPTIRLGSDGAPTVQFTVTLRDRDSVARCRVDREPAVRRKR